VSKHACPVVDFTDELVLARAGEVGEQLPELARPDQLIDPGVSVSGQSAAGSRWTKWPLDGTFRTSPAGSTRPLMQTYTPGMSV
jgi:hypothetical protein